MSWSGRRAKGRHRCAGLSYLGRSRQGGRDISRSWGAGEQAGILTQSTSRLWLLAIRSTIFQRSTWMFRAPVVGIVRHLSCSANQPGRQRCAGQETCCQICWAPAVVDRKRKHDTLLLLWIGARALIMLIPAPPVLSWYKGWRLKRSVFDSQYQHCLDGTFGTIQASRLVEDQLHETSTMTLQNTGRFLMGKTHPESGTRILHCNSNVRRSGRKFELSRWSAKVPERLGCKLHTWRINNVKLEKDILTRAVIIVAVYASGVWAQPLFSNKIFFFWRRHSLLLNEMLLRLSIDGWWRRLFINNGQFHSPSTVGVNYGITTILPCVESLVSFVNCLWEQLVCSEFADQWHYYKTITSSSGAFSKYCWSHRPPGWRWIKFYRRQTWFFCHISTLMKSASSIMLTKQSCLYFTFNK